MKIHIYILIELLLIIVTQPINGQYIVLKNPIGLDREDEPIVVKRTDFKNIGQLVPMLKDVSGKLIPFQLDDFNSDGKWDELAFQYSLKKGEEVKIKIELVTKDKIPEFKPRTTVLLAKLDNNGKYVKVKEELHPRDHKPQSEPILYQAEGPIWENEKVAFRHYLDSRLGKDIFGKTTDKIISESIGIGKSYHELLPWGMDVLKVGNSLGAGATAFVEGNQIFHFKEIQDMKYKLVAEGPVRGIFQLELKGVSDKKRTVDLIEEITIWGGKYWYKRNIAISKSSCDTVATGIVNMKNQNPIEKGDYKGILSYIISHGPQSENHDVLGMALVVPNIHFQGFGKAPETGIEGEVTQTDYIRFKICPDIATPSYFFAGWELSNKDFKERELFAKLVKNEVEKIANPINVKILK